MCVTLRDVKEGPYQAEDSRSHLCPPLVRETVEGNTFSRIEMESKSDYEMPDKTMKRGDTFSRCFGRGEGTHRNGRL